MRCNLTVLANHLEEYFDLLELKHYNKHTHDNVSRVMFSDDIPPPPRLLNISIIIEEIRGTFAFDNTRCCGQHGMAHLPKADETALHLRNCTTKVNARRKSMGFESLPAERLTHKALRQFHKDDKVSLTGRNLMTGTIIIVRKRPDCTKHYSPRTCPCAFRQEPMTSVF